MSGNSKNKDKLMTLEEYQPAFPTLGHNGMKLRDYFAAKAIIGIMSVENIDPQLTGTTIAESAYEIADAMLKERSRERE